MDNNTEKKINIWKMTAISLICLIVVGTGVYFGYNFYTTHLNNAYANGQVFGCSKTIASMYNLSFNQLNSNQTASLVNTCLRLLK